jgi:hypothetical protein
MQVGTTGIEKNINLDKENGYAKWRNQSDEAKPCRRNIN